MPHRVVLDDIQLAHGPSGEASLVIHGEEAEHALRVKRLQAGEAVEVLDGRGRVLGARVAPDSSRRESRGRDGKPLLLEVLSDRTIEPEKPELEVWTAPPKGDRLGDMIDQLSQLGAAAWAPLRTARTVVEPRPGKLDRLARISRESAKQCGRAWLMRLDPGGSLQHALDAPGVRVLAAQAGGVDYAPAADDRPVRVLVGPEGGFAPDELALLAARGVELIGLGPHVLRIETAAAAAAAVVMGITARR